MPTSSEKNDNRNSIIYAIANPTPSSFVPIAIKEGVIVGVGYAGWPKDLRNATEEIWYKYRVKDDCP